MVNNDVRFNELKKYCKAQNCLTDNSNKENSFQNFNTDA